VWGEAATQFWVELSRWGQYLEFEQGSEGLEDWIQLEGCQPIATTGRVKLPGMGLMELHEVIVAEDWAMR
jgi:hypothetical protein